MIFPGNIFFEKKYYTVNKISTWLKSGLGCLVLLNITFYLMINLNDTSDDLLMKDIQAIENASSLTLMQNMHLATYDIIQQPYISKKMTNDPYLFFRDTLFWQNSQAMDFQGDQIQIQKNKDVLKDLNQHFKMSSQYRFGISPDSQSLLSWVTYQFTHADLSHLFSNLIFLILVGSILQKIISHELIIFVYLMSGLSAALFYLLMSDRFGLPLVGASGSVSGLIAFLCVIKNKNNIQWSYFFWPFAKQGQGVVYLPAYLLLPIYLLADLTAVLVNQNGIIQSVAHSAHVGGALCGAAIGLVYLGKFKLASKFLT